MHPIYKEQIKIVLVLHYIKSTSIVKVNSLHALKSTLTGERPSSIDAYGVEEYSGSDKSDDYRRLVNSLNMQGKSKDIHIHTLEDLPQNILELIK